MKITKTGEYRTRSGLRAIVYYHVPSDCRTEYPWRGMIHFGGDKYQEKSWRDDGRLFCNQTVEDIVAEWNEICAKEEEKGLRPGRYRTKRGNIAIISRRDHNPDYPWIGPIFTVHGNKAIRLDETWTESGLSYKNIPEHLNTLLYPISPKINEVWKNARGETGYIQSHNVRDNRFTFRPVDKAFSIEEYNVDEQGRVRSGLAKRNDAIHPLDLVEKLNASFYKVEEVEKEPFRITGPGKYRTRDGREATVQDSYIWDRIYTWGGKVDNTLRTWTNEGVWNRNMCESPLDIVARISDEEKKGVRLILEKREVGVGNIQVVPSLQDMKTGAIIEPSTKSIQFNAAADELPTVNMEFVVQDIRVEEKE